MYSSENLWSSSKKLCNPPCFCAIRLACTKANGGQNVGVRYKKIGETQQEMNLTL